MRERDDLIASLDLNRTTMLVSKKDARRRVVVHRTTKAGERGVQVTYFVGDTPKGHFFARNAAEVVKRAWARLGPLKKTQEG